MYQLKYTNEVEFNIDDLISSLSAQKEALGIIKEAWNEKYKDNQITKLELGIIEISKGSLDENLIPIIQGITQTDMFKSGVDLIEGVGDQHDIAVILTHLVALVILGGAAVVVQKFFGKDNQNITIINNCFNGISNDLKAQNIDINSALELILNKKPKKQLAQMVSGFINPAKKGTISDIVGNGKTLIDKECVAAIPSAIEAIEDDITYQVFENTELRIVATDLEKRANGWAARLIGGTFDDFRVSLVVSGDIDLEKVAHLPLLKADFTLELINKKDGFKPSKIHLMKIYEE